MRIYRVTKHPNGSLSLTVRQGGSAEHDLTGKLQDNPDRGEFYRAVAAELACAAAEGVAFTYDDFDDHIGHLRATAAKAP